MCFFPAGDLTQEVTHAGQTINATQGTHELLTDTISDSTVQAARVDHSGQAQIHSQNRQRKVWLLEGGYTSNTRHLEKIEEKRQQDKTLLKALEMQGYSARLLILTFGVGGTDALQVGNPKILCLGVRNQKSNATVAGHRRAHELRPKVQLQMQRIHKDITGTTVCTTSQIFTVEVYFLEGGLHSDLTSDTSFPSGLNVNKCV